MTSFLFVTHVGETLGHVARALSIAEELRCRNASVAFAGSESARDVVEARGFNLWPIDWGWSHNQVALDGVTDEWAGQVVRSAKAISTLLCKLRPDAVLGFPGIITAQVATTMGIPHFAVMHGPYLAPIFIRHGLDRNEQAVLNLADRVCRGPVNQVFERLAAAGFGKTSYEEFLSTQDIFVPHPGLPIVAGPNLRKVGFIRATLGAHCDVEVDRDTCYVTFGTGNPCAIGHIVREAAAAFSKVLLTVGIRSMNEKHAENVFVRSFVSSSSLAGRVGAVINHGGLGTVGTFAARQTPQLIIPTELDQGVTAIVARNTGIASVAGLDDIASRNSLGRRMPNISSEALRRSIGALAEHRETLGHTFSMNGAAEIAISLTEGRISEIARGSSNGQTNRQWSQVTSDPREGGGVACAPSLRGNLG